MRNKVHATERAMLQVGIEITYQSFKDKWLGVGEKRYMLMEVFEQHNSQMKELIGKEYSAGTYQRYETSKDHTKSFLKWKYKLEDIDIQKLSYQFINNYPFC